MNFKKDYFIDTARDFEVSIKTYYENSKENYVILEDGDVIMWDDDTLPVVFGDIKDAIAELGYWGTTFRNISIITEKELIDTECRKEMKDALEREKIADENSDEKMLVYFMNPYNAHNKELVLLINRLWKKNCGKFRPILNALYDRDLNEIVNSDAFADIGNVREPYTELLVNWQKHAYNYLMHIADDGDLETIINFIRDDEYNLDNK